jgi:hypothetical protein
MKAAISVTLTPDNLHWLKVRARALSRRSVSAVLDDLVSEARQVTVPAQSVVGRVRLPDGERGLELGAREVREAFEKSLARPLARRRRG